MSQLHHFFDPGRVFLHTPRLVNLLHPESCLRIFGVFYYGIIVGVFCRHFSLANLICLHGLDDIIRNSVKILLIKIHVGGVLAETFPKLYFQVRDFILQCLEILQAPIEFLVQQDLYRPEVCSEFLILLSVVDVSQGH